MNLAKHTNITLLTILLFLGTISIGIAEEDTSHAEAVADATRDAQNYNAIYWTTSGALSIPASALFVGTVLGGADVIWLPGVCVCWGTLPIAVLLSSHFVEVSPPTEHLIGKSPEYVSAYVKTYTTRVKRKRQAHVIAESCSRMSCNGRLPCMAIWRSLNSSNPSKILFIFSPICDKFNIEFSRVGTNNAQTEEH